MHPKGKAEERGSLARPLLSNSSPRQDPGSGDLDQTRQAFRLECEMPVGRECLKV